MGSIHELLDRLDNLLDMFYYARSLVEVAYVLPGGGYSGPVGRGVRIKCPENPLATPLLGCTPGTQLGLTYIGVFDGVIESYVGEASDASGDCKAVVPPYPVTPLHLNLIDAVLAMDLFRLAGRRDLFEPWAGDVRIVEYVSNIMKHLPPPPPGWVGRVGGRYRATPLNMWLGGDGVIIMASDDGVYVYDCNSRNVKTMPWGLVDRLGGGLTKQLRLLLGEAVRQVGRAVGIAWGVGAVLGVLDPPPWLRSRSGLLGRLGSVLHGLWRRALQ